jgi:GNAT superfamily N-acetyltransferase
MWLEIRKFAPSPPSDLANFRIATLARKRRSARNMPPPLRAAAEFGISYRVKSEDDAPFIERLYASTRAELAITGWPEELKRQFIAQQQFAQDRHFELCHPQAEWLLIEQRGELIGRLYVEDRGGELWLIDIALMPESRGRGVGTAVLKDLLEQGREAGKPVSLNVFKTNPARHLYERLGFILAGDAGAHDRMIWRAGRDDAEEPGRGARS